MRRYLFVYGTLVPGRAPAALGPMLSMLRHLGRATVPGRLYHLGRYPGAKLCGDGVICGRLLELPAADDDAAGVLARLDRYEGFDPSDERASLFVRRPCTATVAGGGSREAWVYEYNRQVDPARLIAGGDFTAAVEENGS